MDATGYCNRTMDCKVELAWGGAGVGRAKGVNHEGHEGSRRGCGRFLELLDA